MKYIRTKEGVFIVEKEDELYIWCYNAHTKKRYAKEEDNPLSCGCDYIGKHETADTIEELCDEAVFFDNDNVPHYKSKEGELWYLGASLFSTSLRFGIWTDKGLIYVAKMKNKGELELI